MATTDLPTHRIDHRNTWLGRGLIGGTGAHARPAGTDRIPTTPPSFLLSFFLRSTLFVPLTETETETRDHAGPRVGGRDAAGVPRPDAGGAGELFAPTGGAPLRVGAEARVGAERSALPRTRPPRLQPGGSPPRDLGATGIPAVRHAQERGLRRAGAAVEAGGCTGSKPGPR